VHGVRGEGGRRDRRVIKHADLRLHVRRERDRERDSARVRGRGGGGRGGGKRESMCTRTCTHSLGKITYR